MAMQFQFTIRQMFAVVMAVAIVMSILSMAYAGNVYGAFLLLLALQTLLSLACLVKRKLMTAGFVLLAGFLTVGVFELTGGVGVWTAWGGRTIQICLIDSETGEPVENAAAEIVIDNPELARTIQLRSADSSDGSSETHEPFDRDDSHGDLIRGCPNAIRTATTDSTGVCELKVSFAVHGIGTFLWTSESVSVPSVYMLTVDAEGYAPVRTRLPDLVGSGMIPRGDGRLKEAPIRIELRRVSVPSPASAEF